MKSIPIKYSIFEDKDNPIFGESATHISVDDEAGGGFIVLEQFPDEGHQKIRLTLEEVEELHRLANKLITTYDHATDNKKDEIPVMGNVEYEL